VCGLEWDYKMSGNERNAKFDCGGTADVVHIEAETQFGLVMAAGAATRKWTHKGSPPAVKIYAYADGQKCGLEWDGSKSGNERNAKWDCSGSADPVTIENGKIYAVDSDGNKCGLEWDGSSGRERNAKWDCSGSADPLSIPKPSDPACAKNPFCTDTSNSVPKYSDFSTCSCVKHSRTRLPSACLFTNRAPRLPIFLWQPSRHLLQELLCRLQHVVGRLQLGEQEEGVRRRMRQALGEMLEALAKFL